MDKNKREPERLKSILTYRLKLLIIGSTVVVVSWVMLLYPLNLAPEYPALNKYYEGMWEMCTGFVSLLGWILLLVWYILYRRHRRQSVVLEHCTICGYTPESPDDRFCRKCGAELAR